MPYLSLIHILLDMSKIEEGKLSVNHEPFQLQQLLEPLVATIYAQMCIRDSRGTEGLIAKGRKE